MRTNRVVGNTMHWENYISISFHIEWDMIVVTVFEPNWNSIWFKNCHRDHIPFIVKGNGNIVLSVYSLLKATSCMKFWQCNNSTVEKACLSVPSLESLMTRCAGVRKCTEKNSGLECTGKTPIRFPFKLNGIWLWWKLSPRSYHIQFERKWKYSFISAIACHAQMYHTAWKTCIGCPRSLLLWGSPLLDP